MKIVETHKTFTELVASGRVRGKYNEFFEVLEREGFLVVDGITDSFYQLCLGRYHRDFASCRLPDGNRLVFLKSRVGNLVETVE